MDKGKLVREAQKGNTSAYLELFQEYEEILYRTAFIYVKNKEDALDVIQETAYKSFKNIRKLKNADSIKSWLFKITISCALDLLKKQKKIISIDLIYEDFTYNSKNDSDLTLVLKDIISSLNYNEKSIILLRFYYGYKIKEISEMMKMPLGSIKTILYRSLKKMKISLEGSELNEKSN